MEVEPKAEVEELLEYKENSAGGLMNTEYVALPEDTTVAGAMEALKAQAVISRTFAIDIANRSLLSDLLPMQSLRAAGLHLIGSFGPLRRLAMREGLAPSWRPKRRAF